MKENTGDRDGTPDRQQPARKVRLPGFIVAEDIGLGDAVKRAVSYLGVRPCGACQKRAATLNRRIVLTSRRS